MDKSHCNTTVMARGRSNLALVIVYSPDGNIVIERGVELGLNEGSNTS